MGQLALHCAQQVVHLFVVHVQVAVAGDAELPAALDRHAFEQPVDVGHDDPRQQRQCLRATGSRIADAHDARQRARDLHDGEVGVAAEGVAAGQAHDEVQALVLDAREGPSRVQCERREHRLDLGREIVLHPLAHGARDALAAHQAEVLRRKRRPQHLVQHAVLLVDQCVRARRNGGELLERGQTVGAGLRGAELHPLLDPGDADLEEFVEVGGGDRQEAQAFQQGQAGIARLLEHAAVELEQRQLAIDVEAGGFEVGLVH